jgi:MFS family permease
MHATSTPPPPAALTGATLLAAASLTVMANATIAPSLPALRDHFFETPGIGMLVGLVMTLPSLSVVLTGAVAGILCDRIGRRPVLLFAMLLYGIAGASGLFAETINQILVGRIFLGIANAGVMTATQALIADLYHGAARERFAGSQSAAMAVGGVIFLSTGGLLASIDWRYPFLLYAASLVLLPLAAIQLREPDRVIRSAETVAEAFPWHFVIGIAVLAGFGMLTFYMIPVKLPFYLRELGVSSPAIAGLGIAAGTVTSALTSVFYTRIKRGFSPEAIYAITFAIMAIGYTVVAVAWNAWIAVAGVTFAGLGLGLLMPNQVVWMMSRTPAAARGRAAGIMTTAIFLGQFLSPLYSGPLAEATSLATAYGVTAAALGFVALVMATLAWKRHR